MSVVNGTITTGVTLGNPGYDSPLTIGSTGYINVSTGDALSGSGGTVVNYGRIEQKNPVSGVYTMAFYVPVSVINHGTISSTVRAVRLNAGGYFLNTDVLTAGNDALAAAGGAVTVINSGSVSGSTGILLFAGGYVHNTGTVSGEQAISASGGATTVNNSGLVTARHGKGVGLAAGGTVTNSGTIYGGGAYTAVDISGGAGTIIDTGTISAASAAITFSGTYADLLEFQAGSPFIGGAVTGNGATGTLEFAAGTGTLTGQNADFTNFGTASVDAGGAWTIEGNVTLGAGIDLKATGILNVAGTLENAGTISTQAYRSVQVAAAGYLLNAAGGLITNTTVRYDFSPTVIAMGSNATIVNLGTITDPVGDMAVRLNDGGTVVNGSATDTSAMISEDEIGIYGQSGRAVVTNFGTISGDIGVALLRSSLVDNGTAGSTSALITGTDYGVSVIYGPGTVVNAGTISSSQFAIDMRYGGGTVVDSGVINGLTAIQMGASNNLLVLEGGFTITGSIQALGTANVVELSGSASAPVTASYNALNLSGFQTTSFAPGNANYATLKITNDTKLPGTITNFIGLHDTIDLTALGFVTGDTGVQFNSISDQLTVTNGTASVALQLGAGNYSGDIWGVRSDGSGGTDVIPGLASPLTISGTTAGLTTTDEAAIDPFTGVTISDPNIGQTETVTVTLSNNANGTLSDTVGGTVSGDTFTVTGSIAAVDAALDALVFTPTEHQVAPGDTVTTTLTITATDTAGGSATDSTTTVIATAVNDPPTLNNAVEALAVPGQTQTTPFTVLTVTDPDVGHTDTVTITMSDPAGGTFSVLSGGSYDATTGVYSFTGTPAQVNAALAALVFTPSLPDNGTDVGTTTFSVKVVGQAAPPATDDTISVTTVTQFVGLASTPPSDDNIQLSSDGSGFPAATPGKNNEAVITAPSANGSYSLPGGYQAAYLGGSSDAALTDDSVGNAVLVGNSGNDTISASAGNDTLIGGAGANLFQASGSGDAIWATGTATVRASGSGDTTYAGPGALTLTDSGSGDAVGLSTGTAAVTLSGSGTAVYGGSGSASVTDSGTNDAIGGGNGAMALTLTGSGTRVYGGGNTLTLDETEAASGMAIGAGSGATMVTLGGASTTLYGGSGSLTASVTGSDARIGLTNGSAAITLSGSGTEIFGGSGLLAVDDLGTNDTIAAASGAATVTAGGANAVVLGGSGSLQLIGGAGTATVFAGSGSATVTAGTGAMTLYGGAGGSVDLNGGPGSSFYVAGSGAETLNASGATGDAVIFGGTDSSGSDLLMGGGGSDQLFAGTGSETLAGGGGNNEFVFYQGVIDGSAPHDIITDFNSNDVVYLANYGANAASAALAGAVSSNGSTTLTLSDNTQITFLDVASTAALQNHVLSF